MIVSKLAELTDTSSYDNAQINYFKIVLSDFADYLKIDNKSILQYADFCEDSTYTSKELTIDSRACTRRTFVKTVNDFGSIDAGLLHVFSNYSAMLPARIHYTTSPAVDETNTISCAIVEHGKALSITDYINLPYHMYNGQTVAYCAIGHTKHSVTFAKLKSIDDPTNFKYIIIASGKTYTSDNLNDRVGFNNSMVIIDNDNFAYTQYTSDIHKTSNSKIISIEKFVNNGYYSDEIFIFNGDCPSGIFKLDNVTYLNIGFNLYIKIVG